VSPEGYAETLEAFERTIGLRNLAALHVNDSKKPKGSRVDRHEHIGRGAIGRRGFRNLMTDPRLASIPKFLETPKDETLALDRRNLATLRRLASPSPPARRIGGSSPDDFSAGRDRRSRLAQRAAGRSG